MLPVFESRRGILMIIWLSMDKEGELLDGLGGLRDVRVRAKSKGMIF